MTISVEGLNYTVIHSCEDITDGVTGCSVDASTNDPGNFKQGAASVCAILNADGESITFTPTAGLDISASPVRFWGLFAQGGLLKNSSDGGVTFFAGDGSNTGYWYLDGKDTYSGGWKNYAIDLGQTVDEGTSPTSSDITTLGVRIGLAASAKNVINSWVDAVGFGDGLLVYGDNAGSDMSFQDILDVENTATDGGWGILTGYAGQYFCAGELQFGTTATTDGCKFAGKSSVIVFEDRPVSTDLMGITVVDNGDGITEFAIGSRSGDAGIEGCVLRVADINQSSKFFFDASDTDITNFGLYGTTLLDAHTIKLPDVYSTDVAVINSNFESSGEVIAGRCAVNNTNIISANDRGARIADTDHHFIDNSLISCAHGLNFPSGNTYGLSGINFTGCTYTIEFSDPATDSALIINAADGANPGTYDVTGGAGTDSVTINNPIYYTLSGIINGSVALIVSTDEATVFYSDTNVSGNQTQYDYNYSSDVGAIVLITHLDYLAWDQEVTLGGADANLPISQVIDPTYVNP